ncbi:MAG: GIY-YIG nuclease family protein [Ferruginibacter sp.]
MRVTVQFRSRVQKRLCRFFYFKMFVTYILYSKGFDRFYVGSTENIHSRLLRHNNKMIPSTKKYIPWTIIYTEEFKTRAEAFTREQEIKAKKSRKYIEWLISSSK